MDNNFFYHDLAGKRHLRSYLKAAILIVIFMGLVVAYAFWERAQMMAVVNATPRPVAWQPSATPIPPTATPTVTPEPCPTNPSDWTFSYPYSGYNGNLLKIEPACVYEGLERTVAWLLMSYSMGYDGDEAAKALGFEEMPFKPVTKMKIMTDFKGPMEMKISVRNTFPTVRFWNVDEDGVPSVKIVLRGCYRARSIVGLQVDEWGDYPVFCTASSDTEGLYTIAEQGTHRVGPGGPPPGKTDPWRGFIIFGYTGSGQWNYIGLETQLIVELSGLPEKNLQGDRQFMADSHGVSVWDAAWVESTFGIAPRPLLNDWKTFTASEEDKAAILKAAQEFYKGSVSP